MVYLGLPINSMVIFQGEVLNNQRVNPDGLILFVIDEKTNIW